MSAIIYAVEDRNVEEIKIYVNKSNNLPQINSIPYDEDKPLIHDINPGNILVINEESEDPRVKQNTIEQARKKVDELIIPIKSIAIPAIQDLLHEGVGVHLPRVGMLLTRHSNVSDEVLDVLSDYSNDRVLRRHTGGRAPAGTRIENGFIVAADDYDEIRRTLTKYIEESISKQKAADRINTTPRTVERAAKRKQLYQLQ